MKSTMLKNYKTQVNIFAQVALSALFLYAGISKLLTLNTFKIDMARSPLIPDGSLNILLYSLPCLEIAIVFTLFFEKTKHLGFYSAFFLMSLFTIYLIVLVTAFTNVPCSCGGILGGMSYPVHIAFNIFFTLVALLGIYTSDAAPSASAQPSL